MTEQTATENFFKVLSLQHSGDGARVSERSLLLGYAEDDDGRVPFTVPDMPMEDVYYVKPWDGSDMDIRKVEYFYEPFEGCIRMEVLNAGKPREEQRWNRLRTIEAWLLPALVARCVQKAWMQRRAGKTIPDLDKLRDSDNQTPDQYNFAIREWHRRIYGAWIYIGGKLTWLSGAHYYYLTYFKIDTGYPNYRDRDRRWFYVAQAVTESEDCLGLVYLKHRRDGATYRCCCLGLETATRGHLPEANFGIMSKDDESAKEAFKKKTVNPFNTMPFFFTPMVKDKTDVEKVLEFKAPPRSVSERHLADQSGLGATIEYKAKGKKGQAGFDSHKLHILLMDEVGKKKDVSVMEELGLVTPTMDLDGLYGKIFAATTNEELDGDNKDEFRKMWDGSDLAIMKTSRNGETRTKLWRYFTPAYDGLHEAWVGPFGESIVDMPTQEQMDFLMSKGDRYVRKWERHWRQGGAYAYLCRERADKADGNNASGMLDDEEDAVDLLGYIRRYPFTPDESFTPSNPSSDYNLLNISRLLNELKQFTSTGNILLDDLTVRGNLEWMGDVFKGQVKFVPHKDGRWLFNKAYMPGGKLAERLGIVMDGVARKEPRMGRAEAHGKCMPGSDTWIDIGFDPMKTQEEDKKKGKRYSKAAAYAFYPYDFEVEKTEWVPQLEADPNFAKEWVTHAFVFEYLCSPRTPQTAADDMLKSCFFLNARVLFERQLTEISTFFTDAGCRSFLHTDVHWIKDPANATPGLPSSEAVIEMYKARTQSYIDYFCWANKCPFPSLVKQWAAFNGKNISQLDAQVASGFAFLEAKPNAKRKTRRTAKKYDIAADKAEAVHQGAPPIRKYFRTY